MVALQSSVFGIQGDASISAYVKSIAGWKHRTFERELRAYAVPGRADVDVVQTILEVKGVELVAWSRANGIVALQRAFPGERGVSAVGVISFGKDGRMSYIIEGGTDGDRCPLGYAPTLADGTPRSARDWLNNTHDTPFPYAIVRLIQALTVPGLAPDMIVTTQEGYDFSKEWEYFIRNFAGGHGGINSNHMLTPAIFSGNGVSPGVVDLATSEDLGASLHVLLGSNGSPPTLGFLETQEGEDIIAQAYYSNPDGHAVDLLRGSPIPCLARR